MTQKESDSEEANDSEKSETKDEGQTFKEKLISEFRVDTGLLSYKAFYFLFFGGFGASFPYMPLYFRQLGLNASLVGILAGIRPLIQFASAPFWSVISDKFRARKAVLLFSIIAWIVMTLALLVPQPYNTVCKKSTAELIKGTGKSNVPEPELETKFYSHVGNVAGPKRRHNNNGQHPSQGTEDIEGNSLHRSRRRIAVHLDATTTKNITADDKKPTWHFELVRDSHEINKVFMWLMILIVGGEFLEAPTFILADTALLQKLETRRKHYGKTRLFGSLGYATASFVVGAVLDMTTYHYCGESRNDYNYLFYIFAVVMVLAFIFAAFLFHFDYAKEEEGGKVDECAVWKVLLEPKYAFFMTITWYLGFSNGLIFNFLNWYLEDLGASKLLMGSATTMRATGLVISFFVNSFLTDRLGHICVVFLTMLSYFTLFVWLALMRNPLWAFPLEFLEGLTYGTAWSTCVTYMAEATPMSGAATMQGILQGIYWGLGGGLGAILGGVFIDEYGAIPSFYAGGALSIALLVIMAAIHVCMQRKRSNASREWTPVALEDNRDD